jgi:hypothetical protein
LVAVHRLWQLSYLALQRTIDAVGMNYDTEPLSDEVGKISRAQRGVRLLLGAHGVHDFGVNL